MAAPTKLEEQLLKIRQAAAEREAQREAAKAGVSYLDLTSVPVKVDALKLIPENRARRLKVATFELKQSTVALAVLDPEDPATKELIKELGAQDFQVKVFVSSLKGLEHLWSFYRFAVPEKAPITSRVNIAKERIIDLTAKLATLKNAQKAISAFDFQTLSVTEFLEIVFAGALANRTSDIHFEPEEKAVKLRYRIDGILHDVVAALSREFYPSVVSRIKLLANLKINVRDRPQDGRITIGLATKDVELRVAIAPSEYGEIIVMRVLDPDAINITLPQLGLRADDLAIIETEIKRPNGMILNTGPTGSGKTTTLYAFLRSVHNPEIKIITIEDPIEYHLEGIEQTQVDTEAGYTFANGLRSMMRQDPDMILVGEVRDKDTAEIAIQAALTGHLVFSTVHANEAAGAIPRLLDLGVKPQSIGPALNLIIAQRLVRRLCQFCKIKEKNRPDLEAKIKSFLNKLPGRVNRADYEKLEIYKPNQKGCDQCGIFGGYKGRIAIYELLQTASEVQELIMKQAGEAAIQNFALKSGMVTMQQDGILKVINGMTTLEEVEEVTGPISW